MHTITVNEKRGHGFEGEQGRMYERTWGEERKGRNAVIILEIKK